MRSYSRQIRPVNQLGGFSFWALSSFVQSCFDATSVRHRLSGIVAIILAASYCSPAYSQQASLKRPQSEASQDAAPEKTSGRSLTQGLLELVPNLEQSASQKKGSNPFEEVAISMQRSAELLAGDRPQKAVEAQQETLKLLDDLIKQATDSAKSATKQTGESNSRQSGQAQQPPAIDAGQNQETPTTDEKPNRDDSPKPSEGEQGPGEASTGPDGSSQSPAPNNDSDDGRSRNAAASSGGSGAKDEEQSATVPGRLADPVALQRGLWGKLPEQSRRAMETQMVERFLPSHSKQIEAYYRILLQRYADVQQ